MTEIITYAVLAVLLLAVSIWLYRKGTTRPAEETPEDAAIGFEQLDGPSLNLAERIFDAGDCDWLRKELCFPQAAEILERHRKHLAIQWLKALRKSFKDLVRLPQPAAETTGSSAWKLLWLTIRFQLLIDYALLMVRIFGPYHRMVPILGAMHSVRELGFFKTGLNRLGVGRTS